MARLRNPGAPDGLQHLLVLVRGGRLDVLAAGEVVGELLEGGLAEARLLPHGGLEVAIEHLERVERRLGEVAKSLPRVRARKSALASGITRAALKASTTAIILHAQADDARARGGSLRDDSPHRVRASYTLQHEVPSDKRCLDRVAQAKLKASDRGVT